jgi:hypothetical protein
MKPGELKSGIITYPTPTERGAGTADGVKVWPSVETLNMKPGELKSGIITYPTPTEEMGAETADGVKVWPSMQTLKMKPGELKVWNYYIPYPY